MTYLLAFSLCQETIFLRLFLLAFIAYQAAKKFLKLMVNLDGLAFIALWIQVVVEKHGCSVHQSIKSMLVPSSELHARGSKLAIALSRSRCRSRIRWSSLTSLSSSTKNPPLELTILLRSYSKYLPRRESRFRGFGAVGEVEDAGMTSRGRLLLEFECWDEEDEALSSVRCLAFAAEAQPRQA
jgi:hypothetical protein